MRSVKVVGNASYLMSIGSSTVLAGVGAFDTPLSLTVALSRESDLIHPSAIITVVVVPRALIAVYARQYLVLIKTTLVLLRLILPRQLFPSKLLNSASVRAIDVKLILFTPGIRY